MSSIASRIAEELSVKTAQVEAAIALLDEGATVPFIARYRKEATQGLDDTQLRLLQERLIYIRELEERRQTILKSIAEQNKLTPELEASIRAENSKVRLEDLYRPYKPKRRTKGQIAIEAGLEPLADALYQNPQLTPETEAANYINADKGVNDTKAALEGARYILMERFSDDPDLMDKCRIYVKEHALLQSKVIADKATDAVKFQDYFAHQELLSKVPSHRMLAMLRGRKEGFLTLALVLPEELETPPRIIPLQIISEHTKIQPQHRPADPFLQEVIRYTWKVKIAVHLETELLGLQRESAEEEAIAVFKRNLHDLLMAAPAGPKAIMGLDPGLRTGVKVAVIDSTGKCVATDTIYPHAPHNKWEAALATLYPLIKTHQVKLVSIGNGTACRETEKLVDDYNRLTPDHQIIKVVISEAGASVYSASELAAKEFPELDVSLRGAISIARRLQDPLAELVKIEPKAIGVGQYQHDVNQTKLARTLDAVVEDAVNAVGVDVNMASMPLLARIAGLNQQIAQNIVEFREKTGPFKTREQLKKVPRLGDKAFEQAAGFLKVMNGENPLDASSVHPEAYPVVENIIQKAARPLSDIIGNPSFIHSLDPKQFVSERFGLPTIEDIFKELEKPGRDPRATFQTVNYHEGIQTLDDLKPGMIVEGIVTNVANFGAFIDIGVHQDGLVHISELSQKFVKDPRDVIKTGQIVKVKVLEVDKARKRISLSLRLDSKAQNKENLTSASTSKKSPPKQKPPVVPQSSLGLALQAAFKDKK